MRTRILVSVIAIAALAAPATASAALKTERASSGAVSVVLTYKKGPGLFNASNVRISITRAGATLLDGKVAEPCAQCAVVPIGAGNAGKSIRLRDLDGDGEPEVILDMYSGGAHCCSYTWIYRYTGTTYSGTPAVWADAGYTLKDLDRDGLPELSSYDDRFAYTFTDYAESWDPPQIFQFRAGKLNDVTRKFPAVVRRDARRALRVYHGRARRNFDLRGVVAAYVADQYLLGHPATGWRLERSALHRGLLKGLGRGDPWPHGARYAKALRKYLHRWRYF